MTIARVRQHAVVALGQLNEVGLTTSAVGKRVASGRLHRVHRGVYSVVDPGLLTRRGRFMAAVLACGDGALLSHRSAGALHDATVIDAIPCTSLARTLLDVCEDAARRGVEPACWTSTVPAAR